MPRGSPCHYWISSVSVGGKKNLFGFHSHDRVCVNNGRFVFISGRPGKEERDAYMVVVWFALAVLHQSDNRSVLDISASSQLHTKWVHDRRSHGSESRLSVIARIN
jgi:hypothetical protein